MNMQLRMAARYLWGRKLRTVMTTLAVVLGVMLIFGLNGVLPAFVQTFRQNMLAAAGQVDLTVTSETRSTFATAVSDKVTAVEGIALATGLLQRNISLPTGSVANAVTVIGAEPTAIGEVRSLRVADGRLLTNDDSNSILISDNLAQQANLHVGDHLKLPSANGSTDFAIVGILSTLALPGVEEVYISLNAAQTLFNESGRVNTIEAIFAPGVDKTAVSDAVITQVGAGFKLGSAELGNELLASLVVGETVFNLFGILALVMGGFIIFNTFRTVVAERRRDIGLLRAVGASRRTVLGIILAESVLQGVLGTAVGLLAGYGLVLVMLKAISPIMSEYLHFEISGPSFSVGTTLMAIFLGVGVTVVGGLLPARAASRVTPLEALRPVVAEVEERNLGRTGFIGIVLIVLAGIGLVSGNLKLTSLGSVLFLFGLILLAPTLVHPIARIFGGLLTMIFVREGQIAQGNLTRQPGRAAVTASAMMIGIAIVVAALGMISSIFTGFLGYIEKSLGSDFLVMPTSLILSSGNIGAGPDLAQTIADTPGVATVTSLRSASTQVGEADLQLLGIDPTTYPEVAGLAFSVGEPEAAYTALQSGRAVILNGIYASQNQVHVGDTLTFQTPEGEKSYEVVGIAVDYLNAKIATGYISQANLATDFHQTNDVLLLVNGAAGVELTAVYNSLQQIINQYPAFTLLNAADWREEQQQLFKGMSVMLYGLMGLLALPSLIALINTLGINVIERTREIGMIRAVGGTRKQVRRMILIESLLLSIAGTAFGILAGVWLGYVVVAAMNSAGYVLAYDFPYAGVLTAVALGLIFGIIAALLPARQAAQLDIVQALRYE